MVTVVGVTAAVVAAGFGVAGGWWGGRHLAGKSARSLGLRIEQKLATAKQKIAELRAAAEREARELTQKTERELTQRREGLAQLERRVADREDKVAAALLEMERRDGRFKQLQEEAEIERKRVAALREEEERKLAEVSGLTAEQAEARALKLAEDRTREEIVRRLRKLEKEGQQQLEEKGRHILATIIQRYAASHVAETSASYVHVEDEKMIGRVIGKEGRNIQHLERLTGCEIVVDDTPNTIMVSGFSPIRRQVAKTALEKLLHDGRIHPGRIEEVVEEAKKKINDDIKEAGEAVVYDLGIMDLPTSLVQLLGRLKYRTSYRQNILRHSWEAAHIAAMLAHELGADVNVAKKATLLHDIGKAIDHEVEGSHIEIGEKIMRKFGIDEQIIAAAAAHHDDPPYETPEAYIVQVADAISAARPGARRDTAENYVKRMEELENLASSYPGVEKAYAVYAGREVRVFVRPAEVDDLTAIRMSQEIARQIEQQLTYPGEVKVNVIRELRAQARAR